MVLANIHLGGRKGSNHQWNTHYMPSIWHLLSHLILKQMWWLPFNGQGIYNSLRFSKVASVRGRARIVTHNFNSICSGAHHAMSSLFSWSYYKTWLKATSNVLLLCECMAFDAQFWPWLVEEVGRQVSQWVAFFLDFSIGPLLAGWSLQCCTLNRPSLERAMEETGGREKARDVSRTASIY